MGLEILCCARRRQSQILGVWQMKMEVRVGIVMANIRAAAGEMGAGRVGSTYP